MKRTIPYAISGKIVTLAGHGSGKPSTKKMNTYCRSRYNSKTKTALGNKGLIRVRRFIVDDVVPIPDDGEKKVEVVGGNCYVRTAPNTTGAKLGIAKRGDTLVYARKTFENGWLSVIYNGQTAYLSGKYGKIVE